MFTSPKNWFGREEGCCNSRIFMLVGPVAIAMIIVVCVILFGCVDHSNRISTASKYERVKTATGNTLHKIQVFCPGKIMTYVSSGDTYTNNGYVRFEDYFTGEDVHTTCPVVVYPILRKRKTPVSTEPEDLDDLLKNDVVGMMDKAKTPVEQVPVVEDSKRPIVQPGSQSNITINNYNK